MRSHFILNPSVAAACAVVGATTLVNNSGSAQTLIAADYATNSIYSGGWTAGQNGGHGFGAWSFDGTDPTPPGTYQAMTSSSALGQAWTLEVQSSGSGISVVGRPIIGGLQVGQTFQTTIQNPVINAGIYTYRGFDMLFTSSTTNNPGGDNTAALRFSVFDYFNTAMNWHINDLGSHATTVSAINTGASGMIVSFTLNTTNTYTLNLAPVSSPNSSYLTFSGTIDPANLPINYFCFRNYNTTSSGPTDTADNFEMSSMIITFAIDLSIQTAGTNAILSWPNIPGYYLASTTNLGPSAVWNTNLPAPVVINAQNVVTNPIAGAHQFFRLQQ